MGIMASAPVSLPFNEALRNQAAMRSNLSSRTHDPILHAITDDVRCLLRTRWCGIVVIINDEQNIIINDTGPTGIYRRCTSMAAHILIEPSKVLVIPNTANDPRFTGNPFVDDGLMHFYAGAALFDQQHFAIGALCVADDAPCDSFTEEQSLLLQCYADMISSSL